MLKNSTPGKGRLHFTNKASKEANSFFGDFFTAAVVAAVA